MHRLALVILGLAACATRRPPPEPPSAELFATPTAGATIAGVVTHTKTHEPLADALVILACSCLPGQREVQTDTRGIYRFTDLPPGKFTVQVLAGQANVNKSMDLPASARLRASFSVDPQHSFRCTLGESEFRHPRFASGHAWAMMGPDELPHGDHPAWR